MRTLLSFLSRGRDRARQGAWIYNAIVEQALRRLDLVVSINIYLDESTDFADVVLPEHTNLERYINGIVASRPPATPGAAVPAAGKTPAGAAAVDEDVVGTSGSPRR